MICHTKLRDGDILRLPASQPPIESAPGSPAPALPFSGTWTHRPGGKKVTAHEEDCGGW